MSNQSAPMTNTEKSASILNILIHAEVASAMLYFQAASWCSERRYDHSAEFFMKHGAEELIHMKRLMRYMLDTDLPTAIRQIDKPNITAQDLRELIRSVYDHEQKVTEGIFDGVSKVQAIGDHSTFEALQWFVAEQREEEKTFRDLVNKIDVIADGPQALYFIDHEVGKLVS